MIQKKLRVLLAEAGSAEAAVGLRSLYAESEATLELTTVSSVASLIATIRIADPEVILLDLSLADRGSPLDAVRRVSRCAPGVPLIVLADPADKHHAAQSLTHGAMDYLLKGFLDTHTLDRVLRSALQRNTLEGLADLLRDDVTGLYSREGMLTLGARFQEEARRTGGNLVLICALVENLQTLHDGFGPGAADHALKEVTEILADSCRRSDVVARLGEAQFAVLAVDAIASSAPVVMNRIHEQLKTRNDKRSPWGPVDLRLSSGAWSAHDHKSMATFLDAVEADLRDAARSAVENQVRETVGSPR
jgi:diguanylate cyclase (GGDEF)-like protein